MSRPLLASLLLVVATGVGWSSSAQAAPSKKKVKQTAKKCKQDPEACAEEAAAAAGLAGGKKGKSGGGAAPPPPKPVAPKPAAPKSSGNIVDHGGSSSSSSGGGKLHNGGSSGGGKLHNGGSSGGGKLHNGGSSGDTPKESRSSAPPPPKGGKKKHKKGGGKKHKKGGHTVKHHRDGRRGRLGLSGAPRVSVTQHTDEAPLVSYGGEFDLFYRYKSKVGPLFALNAETDGVEANAGIILGARGMLSPKQKVTPIADLGIAVQGVPGWETPRVGPALRGGVDYAVKKNTSLSFLVGGALYVNKPEKEPASLGAVHVGIMLTGWP